jgi:type VI secretion system protein ImpA
MGSSIDILKLGGPISEANPGGEDLEQTPFLAELESQRLFGQISPLAGDIKRDDAPGQPKAVDWRKVRDRSLEALQRSRDLRVLPYLGAAVLRLEGLSSFLALVPLSLQWLKEMPDHVYPRFDGDGIAQANALSNWADRMALVEPLRRTPFVQHRQLGAFSLRHIDLAQGKLKPQQGEEPAPEAQIQAAIANSELADLEPLAAAASAAVDSMESAVALMRERTQGSAAPDFGRLLESIGRITELFTAEISSRKGAAAAASSSSGESGVVQSRAAVGAIRSREDAIRALSAVSDYFREQEPSSAVPLFVDRAKRLIGVNFLEMISEVAPDSLAQVRHAGGLKDDA